MKTYTVKVEFGKSFEFQIQAETEGEAKSEAESQAMELTCLGETNIRSVSAYCQDED